MARTPARSHVIVRRLALVVALALLALSFVVAMLRA